MKGRVLWIPGRTTPSNNRLLRMPWGQRRRLAREWARALWDAELLDCSARGVSVSRGAPLARAGICVERRGVRLLDVDNLIGGCKPILDAMQVASSRHPYGLGWICDDDPAGIDLSISQVRVHHYVDVGTLVTVEPRVFEDVPKNGQRLRAVS